MGNAPPTLKTTEADTPRKALLRNEQAVLPPYIRCQPLLDFLFTRCSQYQQNVLRALERSAEGDKAFVHHPVHKLGVRYPLGLVLQRFGVIPGSAVRLDQGEQTFHASVRQCQGFGL
jgi:hypothetical protein